MGYQRGTEYGRAVTGALNTGGNYDPSGDFWVSVTTSGAPPARWDHTAVWSGSDMIIWGGREMTVDKSDGWKYDPSADSWTQIPVSPLSPRSDHTAVWATDSMIIWGGDNGTTFFADGARYWP
ncbi:MAG: Kelch repeat-containing protein [Planctomycetota bacterium]